MAYTVKVTTVGSSVGIVLPKDLLAKLHIEKGDTLHITETQDGLQLTPYDEKFEHTMEAAGKMMRRYRDTLKKLAE
jgi:putative addiction module antidote